MAWFQFRLACFLSKIHFYHYFNGSTTHLSPRLLHIGPCVSTTALTTSWLLPNDQAWTPTYLAKELVLTLMCRWKQLHCARHEMPNNVCPWHGLSDTSLWANKCSGWTCSKHPPNCCYGRGNVRTRTFSSLLGISHQLPLQTFCMQLVLRNYCPHLCMATTLT
jgi:hypothetical protein